MSAFAVGVENIKNGINLGTLLRTGWNMGASLIFTVGRQYSCREASDTVKSYRQIPYIHYPDWDAYKQFTPKGWMTVGVEITDQAQDIRQFSHPKNCIYILGAEDGGLSKYCIDKICQHVVKIPTKGCLNLAVAGGIIMYDRSLNAPRDLKDILKVKQELLKGKVA